MDEIWNATDIAKYLKLLSADGTPNEQAVKQLCTYNPTFPRPYKLGTRTNRFLAEEIREWFRTRPRSVDEQEEGRKPKRGRPPKAVL